MDFANFWLPLIGGGLLWSIAVGAWFANQKIAGVWFGFAGAVCLLLLLALQLQQSFGEQKPTGPTAAEVAANRAYIAIDTFGVERLGIGQTPRFFGMVRNKGNTPARNMRFYSISAILPNPFPPTLKTLNVTDPDSGVPITLDKDAAIRASKPMAAALTAQEMEMITGTDHRLHFMGIIKYDDVFGIARETRFCLGLSGPELKDMLAKKPPGTVIVETLGFFRYCPRFNDAT